MTSGSRGLRTARGVGRGSPVPSGGVAAATRDRLYPDWFTDLLVATDFETSTRHLSILLVHVRNALARWLRREHPAVWQHLSPDPEPAKATFSVADQQRCDRYIDDILSVAPALADCVAGELIRVRRALVVDRTIGEVLARGVDHDLPPITVGEPEQMRLLVELGNLLDLDAQADGLPDGKVGRQPPFASRRWRVLQQLRCRPELVSTVDLVDVWQVCEQPWTGWFRDEPSSMLAALRADSAGDDLLTIGAYEVASRWWGAGLTTTVEGRQLLRTTVPLLVSSGVQPNRLRLYELGALARSA